MMDHLPRRHTVLLPASLDLMTDASGAQANVDLAVPERCLLLRTGLEPLAE